MVFVNSMSDLFHARVPIDFVRAIFDVIRDTPQHTYQVLTKRAHRLERIADRLDWPCNLWMGVSVESSTSLTESITFGAHPLVRGSCRANRSSPPSPILI